MFRKCNLHSFPNRMKRRYCAQWRFLQLRTQLCNQIFNIRHLQVVLHHVLLDPRHRRHHNLDNLLAALLLQQPMSHGSIEVRPTQLLIAIAPEDVNVPPLANVQQADIQRPAPEIVHHDVVHVVPLVQSVRERGRGGLLEDARDLETRQLERADGGVPLGGFEFGGDGDDGRFDVVVLEVVSGEGAEVVDDVGAYFGGG
mmetsp:Transcript_3353/g.5965  ORF Transcript_3353/g.5965 Transcript_3353/m.5965 type:complete len:199 (+) Transcript_3353:419-1015(+)